DVVRLEAQLERTTQLLAAARARAACDRGDIHEYLELQRHAQGGERAAIRSAWSKDKVHQALERLRPGDVLSLPGAVAGGRLAVITTSRRRGGEVRVGGVSVDTRKITLHERDFGEPPRADRLSGDARRLETRIRGRSESLARQFDRVLRVLEAWGYVDGWRLTGAGERLGRIYHECDLLVAEGLETGLLDGLDPASVAAL